MSQSLDDRMGVAAEPDVGVLAASCDAGVLSLTMNRPGRLNAIDRELGMALLAALDRAIDDPSVRVVTLTGAGRAFCAGDDIVSIEASFRGDVGTNPTFCGTRDTIYSRIVHAIYQCPKPVIAVINGVSAGAGTEIACAADLRLAAASARIGSCLVRAGQVGNAVTLPRVVGPSRAFEIYATGRFVDSEEAVRIGLVHETVPDTQLTARANELAGELSSAATKAIGFYKQLLQRAWGESPILGLRLQDDMHRMSHAQIDDSAEGFRAFVEKRPPRFTGS